MRSYVNSFIDAVSVLANLILPTLQYKLIRIITFLTFRIFTRKIIHIYKHGSDLVSQLYIIYINKTLDASNVMYNI